MMPVPGVFRERWSLVLPLLLCAAVLVLWPATVVLAALLRAGEGEPVAISAGLVARSVAWALMIGVIATFIAWPAAFALRDRRWSVWVLLPMAMPSYLVFHALGLLRDPAGPLGAWIERRVDAGWTDLATLINQFIAVVGLAAWVWPLCAVVVGARLREVPAHVDESLRLDGAGFLRRQWQQFVMAAGAAAGAVGLAAVVMLGSAVPLHLAQAPTLSVAAWLAATLHPGDPGVWKTGVPAIIGAIAAAAVIARRGPGQDEAALGRPAPRASRVYAGLLLALGVVVPAFAYATAVRNWQSALQFAAVILPAFGASIAIASAVGGLCAVVMLCAWRAERAAGGAAPTAGVVALGFLIIAALTPGILVGQAWLMAGMALGPWFAGGPFPVVLAHAARFAGIAALAGVAMARLEPRDVRFMRLLDAGHGPGAWLRLAVAPRAWAVPGVAAATFCLSLHEVEATIILQPPGVTSLSQTMLAQLHFARNDEIAAGSLLVLAATTPAMLLAGWGFARVAESETRGVGRA